VVFVVVAVLVLDSSVVCVVAAAINVPLVLSGTVEVGIVLIVVALVAAVLDVAILDEMVEDGVLIDV